MKLVIDANILFAALIKEGSTAELLISDKLQFFAPEFLFTEFAKYEELILKKTHRSHEEFMQFLDLLKEQINIIPKKEIIPFIEKAENISPDPKDTVYLALAFALKANIWSNDKRLKQGQEEITVFSTEELIEKTNFLKT
ncbi:MAG: putative toxin-antitoxin system toxin component, PIN family [Candidatus Hodarchaeota archaeon]